MIHTKHKLMQIMDRYAKDPKKPLSWDFLAELSGLSAKHLRDVFLYRTEPLTEMIQIRISKALEKIENGEVQVMRNKDNSRFLQYNKNPTPKMIRFQKIELKNGEFQVKLGIKNAYDYTDETLEEQLNGG